MGASAPSVAASSCSGSRSTTLKAAAATSDGSVNDLFVAAAAGGAGAYHRPAAAEVEELRMAMPVSTRSDKAAAAATRSPRPGCGSRVGRPEDPLRARSTSASSATTDQERAVGLAGASAGLGNLLPTPVLVRIVRQQIETVDFTTSNVRGAPFALYIAGARIEANYPIGPLAGTALNLTTLRSTARSTWASTSTPARSTTRRCCADCIEDAFDELLALA